MTSLNLTRHEAAQRAEMLSVKHYDILLNLTSAPIGGSDEASTFESTTVLTLDVKKAGETFIDLRDAQIRRVLIDGRDITKEASYSSEGGLELSLEAGECQVTVEAECTYTKNGQGLHRFVDPADNQTYLYSQFETADAKRVFACFDQPDLKATYSMRVIAPESWTVVSNSAPQISAGQLTSSGAATREFGFSVDVPLSTYLIAFCAGPWHEVHDEWRGHIAAHPETPTHNQPEGELSIPLGLFCRQSIAEHLDAERLFRETKEGFDFYAKHFGEPYPFGKYDQIFCPEYNMGAMENAGCVTIRDEYVFRSKTTGYLYERRNDTILHEMAHMWFGDLVTMQWWDDLWLNESFATWSAAAAQAEVSEFSHAWTTFANVEKAWAYQQDQLPSTHPIAADASDVDTVEQNFDGITYAKGASVLKQLVAYVGEDAFLAGARLHFARHRFGNATFADLLQALSEASGRDLSQWAQQWLTTTGINTLAPEFSEAAGKYTSFAITQDGAAPGAGELRDHRVAVGVYKLRDADDEGSGAKTLQRIKRVELDITGAHTAVPELVDTEVGDVVLVNDDDLTYTMIRLDECSLSTVMEHIGDFADSMPRTLCWSATWQMVRAGQMRARDFVSLVLRGARGEDKVSVLERVVGQAVTALEHYAAPEWKVSTGRALLAQGLLQLAREESDSGRQLIYVNALASIPVVEAGTRDVFEAIVAGTPQSVGLDGLAVDEDMRWRAVTALVAAGLAGEDEIAGLEAKDKSALGVQAATKARAAVPNLRNKIRVFNEATATGDDAPSNLILRNLMAGLTAPGAATVLSQSLDASDRSLLGAGDSADTLAAHFFTKAAGWWSTFSSDTAANLLEGLYPSWEVSKAADRAAEALLNDAETPAPVRRIIAEQQYLVRLSRRAQECDAEG